MNRLITVGKVRNRLSLPDDDGINTAIESAIDAALISVSTVLGFVLEAGEQEDLFYIDKHRDLLVDSLYTLRLSSCLIAKLPAIKVVAAQTLQGLPTASEVPATSYILMAEKGYLKLSSEFVGCFIKVTYTAGVAEEDDAPLWLAEVMVNSTIKSLSSQQVADGKPELTNVLKYVNEHASTIMDAHLRFSSEAIHPIG